MAADDSPFLILAAYNKSLTEVYLDAMHFLSDSSIDRLAKEVELVHMGALVRRLLTGRAGTTIELDEKPQGNLMQTEPYTYTIDGYSAKKPDKKHLVTADCREWYEWRYRKDKRKTTYWLPTEPAAVDTWEGHDPSSWHSHSLKAKGTITGQIESAGPTVEKILASNHVSKEWKVTIIQRFSDKELRKMMLALYEKLVDIIGQETMVSSIRSTSAFEYRCESSTASTIDSATMFIGSHGFLGVACPHICAGDYVVQF